jgi:hypothetical protein
MNLTIDNDKGNNVTITEIEITYKVSVSVEPGGTNTICIPANQCEISVALDNQAYKAPEKRRVDPGVTSVRLLPVKTMGPLTLI